MNLLFISALNQFFANLTLLLLKVSNVKILNNWFKSFALFHAFVILFENYSASYLISYGRKDAAGAHFRKGFFGLPHFKQMAQQLASFDSQSYKLCRIMCTKRLRF